MSNLDKRFKDWQRSWIKEKRNGVRSPEIDPILENNIEIVRSYLIKSNIDYYQDWTGYFEIKHNGKVSEFNIIGGFKGTIYNDNLPKPMKKYLHEIYADDPDLYLEIIKKISIFPFSFKY